MNEEQEKRLLEQISNIEHGINLTLGIVIAGAIVLVSILLYDILNGVL